MQQPKLLPCTFLIQVRHPPIKWTRPIAKTSFGNVNRILMCIRSSYMQVQYSVIFVNENENGEKRENNECVNKN